MNVKKLLKLLRTDYLTFRGVEADDRPEAMKITRLFILTVPVPLCLFWALTLIMGYLETVTDAASLVFVAFVFSYVGVLALDQWRLSQHEPRERPA